MRFRFLLGSTLVLTHPLWQAHKKATAYATRLRTAAAFIFLRVFARRLRLNTHSGSSPPGAFSFSSTKFLPTQTPRMLRCARLCTKNDSVDQRQGGRRRVHRVHALRSNAFYTGVIIQSRQDCIRLSEVRGVEEYDAGAHRKEREGGGIVFFHAHTTHTTKIPIAYYGCILKSWRADGD